MNTGSPSSPSWDQIAALFDAALALPAAEREAFIMAAPGSEALRQEVRSLLAHASEETGPGGTWRAKPMPALAAAPAEPGQRLGAWRVLRPLGEGGMGEVFEAERADGQFEGRAAIKLLKRGMDSAAVLARFALERSALARLNHPHIAHLYDAGQSDVGLPYFVMEYVDGKPIDAAARELPLEGKLALFLQLTSAVAHAHRNLLLHRDLKPGNVLVTAEGQVKLLDFGIAKALEPQEGSANTTVNTPRPFTPQYASPEQVRGQPASTATDVYSLGVLLYELLTGVRPTGRGATSPIEAARSVLEEQPTRPSALSPQQVSNPQWLATRKRLEGDLDNILLKALDKSPEGRYLSVDAFAADIRAYLSGHPVSAQAPSAWYLASRFIKRHRLAVSGATLALLAVLSAAGVALWQAHEAARQRDLAKARFDEVRQLAKQLVFKYHDQIATLPGANQAREALLADASGFLDGLNQAAQDDHALAAELAGTWYRLSQLQGVDPMINIGQFSKAEASLDKALALTRRYAERPETPMLALMEAINMHVSRAELWQARGELKRADAALRQGLPLLQRALTRDARSTEALASAVSLHGVHARILGNQMNHAHLGRWQEACESADRAREAAETTAAADPKNKYIPDTLAFTIGEQAHCRVLAGRLDEADALFARQVALRDQMAAVMPEDVDFAYQRSVARAHRAQLWSRMARHAEARKLLDEAIAMGSATAAADPGNSAGTRRVQAMQLFSAEVHARAGQPSEARTALLAVLQNFPASDQRRFANIRVRAEALIWQARVARAVQPAKLDEAARAAREAAELLAPPREDDDNVARRWMLAQAWVEEAEALRLQDAGNAAAVDRAKAALQALQPHEALPAQLQPVAAAAKAMLP